MAKEVTLRQPEGHRSARQLQRDWNLTVLAMIVVTILVLIALTAALFFAAISPYTTGGAVNP
ncbi:MAG TPA: hypothetical protein VF596_02950 [Pyrinomonadaceae bacterium]|jgi:hypothetical protein